MKVLIVTNLYPNDREPGRGIFNKQQFDELAKLCDIKIIAPVAWRLQNGKMSHARSPDLQSSHKATPWHSKGPRAQSKCKGDGDTSPAEGRHQVAVANGATHGLQVKGSVLASSLWSAVCGLWSAVCGDARHSCTAAMHRAPHPVVFHPRWVAIPVIGRRWHGRFYYWGIRKLFRRLCREWQPDVVLATWAYPDAYAVSMLLGSGGFSARGRSALGGIPPIVGGVPPRADPPLEEKPPLPGERIGSQNQRYNGEEIGDPPLPFVLKVHGSDINTVASAGGEWRVRKLLATLERANAVVCVSRGLKASIREVIDHRHQTIDHRPESAGGSLPSALCPLPSAIHVIPNGVDTNLFHPMDKAECRNKLRWAPEKKHVLFVGNLVPVKGVKYLIRAMDDLPDDVVLHVVGGGKGQIIDHRPQTIDRRPNSTFIEPQAPTQPTTQQPNNPTTSTKHRILFHGRVPHEQIPIWMNAADVLCLPSLNEGCPNVIVESLSCGTPVVASNVGSIPELIDSDVKGQLVPAGDSKALACSLKSVLARSTGFSPSRVRSWIDSARDLYALLTTCAPEKEKKHGSLKTMPDGLPREYYRKNASPDEHQARRLAMVERLIRECSGSCLDYGCGYGDITYAVSGHFSSITGVDVSRDRITWASREFDPVKFAVCSPNRLDYADSTFDTVLSVVVLNWVPDPVQYLKEAHRVLRPQGKLVLAAAAPDAISYFTRRILAKEPSATGYNAIPLDQMIQMLKQAGFVMETTDCFYDPVDIRGLKKTAAECLRLPMRLMHCNSFAPYYGICCRTRDIGVGPW